MQEETAEKLADLEKRSTRQRKRFFASQPQSIGKVLGQVVLQKRYACSETNAALDQAWAEIVGSAVAARCQATGIKRGKFEVTVAHSAIAQELSFDAVRILARLRDAFPETTITGVKYRVGNIEKRT